MHAHSGLLITFPGKNLCLTWGDARAGAGHFLRRVLPGSTRATLIPREKVTRALSRLSEPAVGGKKFGKKERGDPCESAVVKRLRALSSRNRPLFVSVVARCRYRAVHSAVAVWIITVHSTTTRSSRDREIVVTIYPRPNVTVFLVNVNSIPNPIVKLLISRAILSLGDDRDITFVIFQFVPMSFRVTSSDYRTREEDFLMQGKEKSSARDIDRLSRSSLLYL